MRGLMWCMAVPCCSGLRRRQTPAAVSAHTTLLWAAFGGLVRRVLMRLQLRQNGGSCGKRRERAMALNDGCAESALGRRWRVCLSRGWQSEW